MGISVACIAFLTASELWQYLAVDVSTRLFVDVSTEEPLLIHMNITFPSLPCGVASLDKQDAMGLHVLDLGDPSSQDPNSGAAGKNPGAAAGDAADSAAEQGGAGQKFASSGGGVNSAWATGITKWRLTPTGSVVGKEVANGLQGYVSSVRQIDNKEGCQIIGSIAVNKVPGNFHVSAHTRKPGINPYQLDVSHTIHHLSFGDKTVVEFGPSELPPALAPLNGQSKKLDQAEIVEYYIKIVPTTLQSLSGDVSHSFQFTAHSNSYKSNQFMAACWFKYELRCVFMLKSKI